MVYILAFLITNITVPNDNYNTWGRKQRILLPSGDTPQPSFPRLDSELNAPKRDRINYWAEFGSHPEDKFLDRISKVESSGGRNTKHKVVETGLQKGDRAIGKYGLMPNTVREIGRSIGRKTSDLGNLLGVQHRDPEIEELAKLGSKEIHKRMTEQPSIQDRAARYLATLLNARHSGDSLRKAYGWNQGHHIKTKDITDKKLNIDYIKKFKDTLEK